MPDKQKHQGRPSGRLSAPSMTKICYGCKEQKVVDQDSAISDFHVNKRNDDGSVRYWQSRCKKCSRELRVARTKTTVPVEVVQRAFNETGLSYTAAAVLAGFMRTTKNSHGDHLPRRLVGDTARLRRLLGVMKVPASKKETKVYPAHFTKRIRYEKAVHLIQSWGLDPVDYDL